MALGLGRSAVQRVKGRVCAGAVTTPWYWVRPFTTSAPPASRPHWWELRLPFFPPHLCSHFHLLPPPLVSLPPLPPLPPPAALTSSDGRERGACDPPSGAGVAGTCSRPKFDLSASSQASLCKFGDECV
eukprot:518820-Rhodomonas_salina.1